MAHLGRTDLMRSFKLWREVGTEFYHLTSSIIVLDLIVLTHAIWRYSLRKKIFIRNNDVLFT